MHITKNNKHTQFSGLYETTAYVQNHTLINRGITTIGGSTIPQCLMSNNKDERRERAMMGGIYFIASYLTPILLLPVYNKNFLKNKGIIKSGKDAGNKIIQVSKKYLTLNADLKEGLKKTAKELDKSGKLEKDFLNIYKNYKYPENLKKDLLNVHEKILMTDYITTAIMWSAIPFIATEITERKTGRNDFSAGFELKENDKNVTDNNKKKKTSKIIANILLSVIPGILFAKTVTKGLNADVHRLNQSKNIFKNIYNSILKTIAKNPEKFNYASGTNMSKTIYASIWAFSSFGNKIISARDKNERKDRALRDVGLFTMFFGGDFLINNILGRTSDKLFNTQIMDKSSAKKKDLNFIEKFKLPIKNFKNLNDEKRIQLNILNKTKKAGAIIYWTSLLTNTALIGFLLPNILNKMLKKNIEKENY